VPPGFSAEHSERPNVNLPLSTPKQGGSLDHPGSIVSPGVHATERRLYNRMWRTASHLSLIYVSEFESAPAQSFHRMTSGELRDLVRSTDRNRPDGLDQRCVACADRRVQLGVRNIRNVIWRGLLDLHRPGCCLRLRGDPNDRSMADTELNRAIIAAVGI
jgi:hypothetical protein